MKIRRFLFNRTTMMIVTILGEALLIMALANWLGGVAGWIAGVLRLIGILIVLEIVRTSRHLASDLMWIFLIMLFPVFGTAFYLFVGSSLITSKETRSLIKSTDDSAQYYKTPNDSDVLRQAMNYHSHAVHSSYGSGIHWKASHFVGFSRHQQFLLSDRKSIFDGCLYESRTVHEPSILRP